MEKLYREIKNKPLFDSYSEKDLVNLGFGSKELENLKKDPYNRFFTKSGNYFGFFLLNHIIRKYNFKSSLEYISAYPVSEIIGIDFCDLFNFNNDQGEKIVKEQVIDGRGKKDLCIAASDIHFCVFDNSEINKENESSLMNELAVRYSKTKNTLLREELILESQFLVRYISFRMSKHFHGIMDIEDLRILGNIGLLEGVDNFDHKKNTKFKTYIEFRIRGAMLDAPREEDVLGRVTRNRVKKMNKFIEDFYNKNEKEPTKEECKKFWVEKGFPDSKFEEFYCEVLGKNYDTNPIELIDSIYNTEKYEDDVPEEEFDGQYNSLDVVQIKELESILIKDLNQISNEKHRSIVKDILDGESVAVSGGKVGLSESEASAIKNKYLSSSDYFKGLRSYFNLPDIIELKI
ncbi:MAG: sigma-70 family RNA polymerase sigma factor [Nanoarchaeota archaeon]